MSYFIQREDIRKGDRLEISWKVNDASKSVTGIAFRQDWDGDWVTEGNVWLTDGKRREAELFLLHHRPVMVVERDGE